MTYSNINTQRVIFNVSLAALVLAAAMFAVAYWLHGYTLNEGDKQMQRVTRLGLTPSSINCLEVSGHDC